MGSTLEANFRNTMTHSAECLRKAVPLMVKYNIAVTPANYALWYSYVSGNHPNLNVKLDAALRTYGTCPPALSRELFEEFLSDKDLELFDSVVDNIEEIFDQVNVEMSSTLHCTKDFSQVLQECNQDLTNFQEVHKGEQDLLSLVDKLAEESRIMQDVAVQFQSRLEKAQKEINKLRTELTESKQQASKDTLTGLNNRRVFDEDVVMMCSSKQQTFKLYLMFVDIDHFKKFNDDFGHQKGDLVLKSVAQKLISHSDHLTTPYRYGGEEFCVLCQFKNADDAYSYAERVRKAIEKLQLKDNKTGKNLHDITASIGVSEYANETTQEFIERADKALYQAKEQGRNRVIFSESL